VSKMQESLVREFASTYKLNHHFVLTGEMDDPHYTANPTNRCYFCKSELYNALIELKEKWQVDVIFDGSNADDVGDYRPGRTAAYEASVKSPLIEAGIRKEDLRFLSKDWGLPTWNLPAMPCLSSRLPYGVEVTAERLEQIEEAESFVRSLGFRDFRVRHHNELARIEISQSELPKIMSLSLFKAIDEHFKSLGYQYVTVDLRGFRSGSLNELLDLQT
ncbi:MAG: ATP-dependent sacrificial sulfur transferase LarE, partial [bacterium]